MSTVLPDIIQRLMVNRSGRLITSVIVLVVCLRVSTGGGSNRGMRNNKG